MPLISQGKTNIKYLAIALAAGIFAAVGTCSYTRDIGKEMEKYVPVSGVQPQSHLVGGDKDEHGCIGSAGYSWCEAKNSCIRVWEQYCAAVQPKTVVFVCDASKTIKATFYPGDDKFVDLVLSDERSLSVPRAVSASGARYAKADETFVFWNKGDTAFITEGTSSEETFSNCVLREE